jgi:hypothetical protein
MLTANASILPPATKSIKEETYSPEDGEYTTNILVNVFGFDITI